MESRLLKRKSYPQRLQQRYILHRRLYRYRKRILKRCWGYCRNPRYRQGRYESSLCCSKWRHGCRYGFIRNYWLYRYHKCRHQRHPRASRRLCRSKQYQSNQHLFNTYPQLYWYRGSLDKGSLQNRTQRHCKRYGCRRRTRPGYKPRLYGFP